MSKWKFGLTGLGKRAESLAEAIGNIENAELSAVSSTEAEKRLSYITNYAESAYIKTEDLLNDSDLDMIVVAGPNHLHAETAMAALGHGHHVIVASPLALSREECEDIIAAEEMSAMRCFVAIPSFYSPLMKRLKRATDGERIGRLISIDASVHSPRRPNDHETGWKGRKREEGGIAFEAEIQEMITKMLLLAGDADEVTATGRTIFHTGSDSFDTLSAAISFRKNVLGTVTATTAEGLPCSRMEIRGTEGRIVIEDGILKVWDTKDGREEDDPMLTGFREKTEDSDDEEMLRDMISSLEQGTPGQTNAWQGKRIVKLLEAIEKSAEEKKTVKLG